MEGYHLKLKEGWVLTTLADEHIAVPVGGNAADFKGVVRLNETGRDVWNGLAEGMDEAAIAEKLVQDYEGVTADKAREDVRKVIDALQAEGLLEE